MTALLVHEYNFDNKDKLALFFIRSPVTFITNDPLSYIEIQFIKYVDNVSSGNCNNNYYNINHSEYFPLEKYEEAIKAFKTKIESNGRPSFLDYTFEDIKTANDNIIKRIENVKK